MHNPNAAKPQPKKIEPRRTRPR